MDLQLIRSRALLVPIVIALLLAPFPIALSTSDASAHRLGGAWSHTPGTPLRLYWTQNGDYRAQVVAALDSWLASPTAVYTGSGYETSPYYSQVDYYTVSSQYEEWWGITHHHPCEGGGPGCWYSWVNIELNSDNYQLGTESDFTRQKVAAHEFGHALGLAHPCDFWCAGVTSLMRQGSLSYNTPQQHDIDDTNAIYPR